MELKNIISMLKGLFLTSIIGGSLLIFGYIGINAILNNKFLIIPLIVVLFLTLIGSLEVSDKVFNE